jgi:hypothetical protein
MRVMASLGPTAMVGIPSNVATEGRLDCSCGLRTGAHEGCPETQVGRRGCWWPACEGGDLLSLILSLRGWVSGLLWVAGEDGIQNAILVPFPSCRCCRRFGRLTEKNREHAGAIMSSAVAT